MTVGLFGLDWGDVPSWFAATVTSGSFVLAANAYRKSVSDKERGQASKIAAWVAIERSDAEPKLVLHLSNSSDASAFEVAARVMGKPVVNVTILPPGATINHDLPTSLLERSMVQVSPVKVDMSTVMHFPREAIVSNVDAAIEFRDALGRWWKSADGKLARIKQRPVIFNRATLNFTWGGLSTGLASLAMSSLINPRYVVRKVLSILGKQK